MRFHRLFADVFKAECVPKKTRLERHQNDPEVMERMVRQILPCQFHIKEVQSTWKLNQNKLENARLSVEDQVEEHTVGYYVHQLESFTREA